MSTILALAGSPSPTSRTAALTDHIADLLRADDHAVDVVRVRELPADALLSADATDPAIADVVAQVELADGVLVASPVYKAAYSGVLKALLDLLPQFALAGKTVLPVLTGGTPAHVLAVDYALRPVRSSLHGQSPRIGHLLRSVSAILSCDRHGMSPRRVGPKRAEHGSRGIQRNCDPPDLSVTTRLACLCVGAARRRVHTSTTRVAPRGPSSGVRAVRKPDMRAFGRSRLSRVRT